MTREQINNKEFQNIIPELNPAVCIFPFDKDHFLLECEGRHLKVRTEMKELINLINGKNNIERIKELYKSNTGQYISDDYIKQVLFVDLSKYGVVKSDEIIMPKARSLHLRLSFIFWKGRSLHGISKLMSFMFNFKLFYSSLLAMVLFVTLVITYNKPESIIDYFQFGNILWYAIVSFGIVLLHELGHVAACNKFGAIHKGIGFGFYLFTPVFFADVSDAWKLPKKERIVINLAGVYIEFLIATILFCCFLIIKNILFLYIGIAILFHIVSNLNPFLKYDGYWIVSDLTNIPNLREQSQIRFRNAFSFTKLTSFLLKDTLLFLYAISSYIVIGLFLWLIFVYNTNSILHFPFLLWNALINVTHINLYDLNKYFEKITSNIIPLLFYVLILRIILRSAKTYFTRDRHHANEK